MGVVRSRKLLPYLKCTECAENTPIRGDAFLRYFVKLPMKCLACNKAMDWWDTVLANIRGGVHPVFECAAIGAQGTMVDLELRRDTPELLRWTDYGIPPDAVVLDVSYFFTFGDLRPLEAPMDFRARHVIPPELWVYPVRSSSASPDYSRFDVLVTWGTRTTDDAAATLLEAFHAFVSRRLRSAIVPANTAVEVKLSRLMRDVLARSGVAQGRIDGFLPEAGFSAQLNVLLPAFLNLVNGPQLDPELRGNLNRLNRIRNKLAHTGELIADRDEVAQCLCAALFGAHFLNFVRPSLMKAEPPAERTPDEGEGQQSTD